IEILPVTESRHVIVSQTRPELLCFLSRFFEVREVNIGNGIAAAILYHRRGDQRFVFRLGLDQFLLDLSQHLVACWLAYPIDLFASPCGILLKQVFHDELRVTPRDHHIAPFSVGHRQNGAMWWSR